MNWDQIPPQEKFAFQKVLPDDWKKYREIRLSGLESDPQAFGSTYEKESKEDESFWKNRLSESDKSFYAIEAGSIFVATAGSRKTEEGRNRMIFAVYTLPTFRGKHLSQELIQQIINDAKKEKAVKVSLTVNILQNEAVNLYKKMGFTVISKEKDIQMGGSNVEAYYMEKKL